MEYLANNKHKELAGIIDDIDSDIINNRRVNLDSEGYARIGDKRLHRIIIERLLGRKLLPGYMVDHKNRNKLDNKRENLVEVTCLQNNLNKSRGTRLHFGSTFLKNRNKWQAQIKINGKQTYLGVFDTEQQAQDSYVKKARELGKL